MRVLRTEDAPAPVAGAPYSQGIVAEPGQIVYVSGQVPIDPATGKLVGDDVGAQTTLCLQHVASILAAAGAGLEDVAKTTIYLADLRADFPAMNDAYRAALGDHVPARATVGVAALPLGARVEIEAVAIVSIGVTP